ncbi:purine/pyrimidine permease [Filibacter tadaridae]|uniref:Purine permease YwdJ n=1 Tax=Filibacter tadaridae TaxID=2483811 RepID=A0A3P5X2G0_9BACL|nr:purine/pyrimidine permease [Filibacter tadaridae]VDC29420.1 Putative purine permease YwdJ [Filibacter tadaridae]
MKNFVGGIQWAVFLVASSIAAPIAIAHVFGMEGMDTTLFIQRTIFVLGIACLIQAFIGHKLPINEGPAGLWWGVFVVYAGMTGALYPTMEKTFQALQSGLLYSGILFIILAYTGLVSKMKKLFTPTVTFIYLILLVFQLSGTFIKGMFGIESTGDPFDGVVALGSVAVILFTLYSMNHRTSWIQKYSVLLSIGLGWLLFLILKKTPSISFGSAPIISLPDMLVFGKPVWDGGMFVTSLFITLLLITNMIASIRVMENLYKHSFHIEKPERIKEGAVVSGINHLLAGLFSAIGPVPISGAAGFVSATKMKSLRPFIIGSVIVVTVSLFPAVMTLFAALPVPVAYAVTFAIFTKMVEMAFHELEAEANKSRAFKVSAFGLMIGVGLMFVPVDSLSHLPSIVISLLSNGLVTGTIIAIIIEQYLLKLAKKSG